MAAVQVPFTSVCTTALLCILLHHLFFCSGCTPVPCSQAPGHKSAELQLQLPWKSHLHWDISAAWVVDACVIRQMALGGSVLHWQDLAAQKDLVPLGVGPGGGWCSAVGAEETWGRRC